MGEIVVRYQTDQERIKDVLTGFDSGCYAVIIDVEADECLNFPDIEISYPSGYWLHGETMIIPVNSPTEIRIAANFIEKLNKKVYMTTVIDDNVDNTIVTSKTYSHNHLRLAANYLLQGIKPNWE